MRREDLLEGKHRGGTGNRMLADANILMLSRPKATAISSECKPMPAVLPPGSPHRTGWKQSV
jgi:hypothetical protein